MRTFGWAGLAARSQESQRREDGLSGEHLRLGQPSLCSGLGTLPLTQPLRAVSWKDHPGLGVTLTRSDRSPWLQGVTCPVYLVHSRCLTSDRETSWSLYPESFHPPKPALDLAVPGRLRVQLQPMGVPTWLLLAITATLWPQLPVLAQSYGVLKAGSRDSGVC